MSTSGSSNWPTNGALPEQNDQNTDPTKYPARNSPPDQPPGRSESRPPGRAPFFSQEGINTGVDCDTTNERAFRWALYYADRQSAVAYWWGLGAGLALGVLIGSFAASTALVAALFHGK
jgi:hypothetical protein